MLGRTTQGLSEVPLGLRVGRQQKEAWWHKAVMPKAIISSQSAISLMHVADTHSGASLSVK